MKKSFRLLALLLLVVAMCFAVVSCGGDDTPESTVITNDFGAIMQGGGFGDNAVLNTEPLATDSAERATAIEKVVEFGVPLADKAVAVYDIYATLDGAEVQPNGKVRVSVPAPIASITSYDVFHVADNGSVEILDAVTADGKIVFETASFSKFLVASKISVDTEVLANAPSYVAPYQAMSLGNATVNVNSMYQHYGNFKVGTDATEYFTYQTYANSGDKITLTAIPNEGYEFVRWSKDGVTVSENATFEYTVAEGNNQLYAQFDSTTQYYIEIVNDGYNYLYGMNSINGGIPWGTVSESVDIGEQVTVTFTPAEGYRFVGLYTHLSEEPITTNTTYTFTATESVKYWALYEPVYDCTLAIENAGYAYSMGDNFIDDYTCYGGTQKELKTGDVVTLRFVARPGFRFVGVYNADDPDTIITTDTEYTYTVTGSAKLYAIYESVPAYTMIVSTVNINSWQFMGTVTYAYGNLSGSYFYKEIYEGTEVTLDFDLYDESIYRFLGWYDGYNIEDANLLSTEREYTFAMNSDKRIYAHFEEAPDSLVTVERLGGPINGAQISLGGITNTLRVSDEIAPGSKATVSITIKDNRYEFRGWYDGYGVLVSEDETYEFTPDGDTYLFASVAERDSVNVTVGVNSNFEGWFMNSADGKKETYRTYKIYVGDSAFVTANANKGYKFIGWYVDEECISTDPALDLGTLADGTYVQATFAIKETEIGTVTNVLICDESMNNGWYFEGDFASRTYTATITAGDANVSDLNELYLQCIRFGINGEKLLQAYYDFDVDFGNYDPNVVGVYEVYLTYKADPSIVLKLIINVVSDEFYNVSVIAKGGAGEATIVGGGTSAQVKSGTELTFTQTPLSDRIFGGWYYLNSDNSLGEFITYDDECTVKITSDVKIGAYYYSTDDRFAINASAINGSVVINGRIGTSHTAKAMENVTLGAFSDYGYRFVGWYVDGELLSELSSITYTATADLDVEARFAPHTVELIFNTFFDGVNDTNERTVLVDRGYGEFEDRSTFMACFAPFDGTVRIVAKTVPGYSASCIVVRDYWNETTVYNTAEGGYVEFTIDTTEIYSVDIYYVADSEQAEDIDIYFNNFYGDCADCYVLVNGQKLTKDSHPIITVKADTYVSIVAVECGNCEGFRYYTHRDGSLKGEIVYTGAYTVFVTTDICRKSGSETWGYEYDFNFDVCFGYETIFAGVSFSDDVDDVSTGFDVRFENVLFGGEKVTLEDTNDITFGAVLGETVRITLLDIPYGYKFSCFEITLKYTISDSDRPVIETIYLYPEDFTNGYCDFVFEHPGYYEFYVEVFKVVN